MLGGRRIVLLIEIYMENESLVENLDFRHIYTGE